MADSIPKYKLKAGRKAIEQLVRAVASADLARTGTLPPVQRAEAARALADLHELETGDQVSVVQFCDTAHELREAAAALVEVYSISLREVAALDSAHAQGQRELEGSDTGTSLLDANGVRSGGQVSSSSSSDSRGTAAAASTSEAHGSGPSSEEFLALLVDSSAVVANLAKLLWAQVTTNTADSSVPHFHDAGSWCATQTRAATCGGTRKGHFHSCAVSMVSALLHSDALPALSRLLSAEAQRGPARALLTPRQLATCLKPLSALFMAAHKIPDVLLPANTQSLRQPRLPLPCSQSAATSSTSPGPSCVPSTPHRTPGTAAPPAGRPSATTPAAISSDGSVTAAPPATCPAVMIQPHAPQTLGPAVLCAVAESGVVEAACKVAIGALEQGGGGRQQQSPGGNHSALLHELLSTVTRVHDATRSTSAVRDKQMQDGPLRTILTGPCAQYVLAAHSVSQLHAVDGGTTYGLPCDSLLPPVREEGETGLSCNWLIAGVTWWANVCRGGGLSPLQPLSAHNLFELCLREAEVAADCWQRRNGLPAAAAAAGGVGRASGSRSRDSGRDTHSSRSTSSREQGPREVERTRSTGVYLRPASLEVFYCPALATLALDCSRCILDSCCGQGASQGVSEESGDGSDTGGKGGGEAGGGSGGGGGGSRQSGGGVGGMLDSGGGGYRDGETCGIGSRKGKGEGSRNSGSAIVARDGPPGDAVRAVSKAAAESPAAWLCDGGPLARRWWRAAVAAVHCILDQDDPCLVCYLVEHAGHILSAPMPDQPAAGPAMPATPPAALSAALDAGYLPCLERTLRTCFRSCANLSELMNVHKDLLGEKVHFSWAQLLAFGEERAAAALLATAAKGVLQAMVRVKRGADLQGWPRFVFWFNSRTLELLHAGEDVAKAVAKAQRELGEAAGVPFSAACSATESSSRSNGGAAGGGLDSAGHVSAAADAASGLAPPAQQLVRLLSYGLALWLPLYLELPALCNRAGVDTMTWACQVASALNLLRSGLLSMRLALQRGDMRAAGSWRGLLGSGHELGRLLARWRERMEQEVLEGIVAGRGGENGSTLLTGIAAVNDVQQALCVLDRDADAQDTYGEPGQEEADIGERPQLPSLLSPPCNARQVLPCCSNPRCAELAGDSEAGVVLRRCGGACGGAAAYCCAACQRAHWGAGHKEECTGRRCGGPETGAARGGG